MVNVCSSAIRYYNHVCAIESDSIELEVTVRVQLTKYIHISSYIEISRSSAFTAFRSPSEFGHFASPVLIFGTHHICGLRLQIH